MLLTRTILTIIAATLICSGTAHAKDPKISFTTGYIVGDREGDLDLDTDVEIIPIGIAIKTKQWKVKLSTAYIRVTGPDIIIDGGDLFFDEEEESEDQGNIEFIDPSHQRKGFGDTFITVEHHPTQLKNRKHKVTLGYKLKTPTGDEDKGLSSGEIDHHFYIRGHYRIKRIMLLGRLGYQIMGDSEDRDYNNRLYGGIGAAYIINRMFSVGTQYYTKEASLDGRDDIESVSAILQIRPSKKWSAAFNITEGLSDSTMDRQIGMQVSHHF